MRTEHFPCLIKRRLIPGKYEKKLKEPLIEQRILLEWFDHNHMVLSVSLLFQSIKATNPEALALMPGGQDIECPIVHIYHFKTRLTRSSEINIAPVIKQSSL